MKQMFFAVMCLALAVALPMAQAQQPSAALPSAEARSPTAFAALPGRWVRLEGGYVMSIKAVDASGQLDAIYANPRQLPFSAAVATSNGGLIKLFLELNAGGYNGSTYTLNYDPASDRFKGVFHQAVAKQHFEVIFVRSK